MGLFPQYSLPWNRRTEINQSLQKKCRKNNPTRRIGRFFPSTICQGTPEGLYEYGGILYQMKGYFTLYTKIVGENFSFEDCTNYAEESPKFQSNY